MTLVSDESVITEPIVINTVRKFIDTKKAVFYPKGQHPSDLQIVTLGSADYDYKTEQYHKATDEQIADLLKKKVYWLGFRRGNQTTSVCIADPYDAVYLGVPTQRLEQAAAILGADGLVEVSGLYAHAGNKLLRELVSRPRAVLSFRADDSKVVAQQRSRNESNDGR